MQYLLLGQSPEYKTELSRRFSQLLMDKIEMLYEDVLTQQISSIKFDERPPVFDNKKFYELIENVIANSVIHNHIGNEVRILSILQKNVLLKYYSYCHEAKKPFTFDRFFIDYFCTQSLIRLRDIGMSYRIGDEFNYNPNIAEKALKGALLKLKSAKNCALLIRNRHL